ncbi:MAG: MATE family efflux transporter [Victivallaceae bacterium]|nr:MATE family efflux transporter [Victivallaceae bacterium]
MKTDISLWMIKSLEKLFSKDTAGAGGGYLVIWRVAYPLIIMSASHTIMQFCDRKFLAYNSTEDVAAALPGGILSFTLFSFFMVTVFFTSALVAQYFGNDDRKACVSAAWNGFYFALGAAVIILFLLPWIGVAIINNSGHPAELIARERSYFITLIPSGAFICLGAAFSSYFSGQGKTWNIAIINMISCLLNIGLDYLLIFGKWGFPAMGISGAGIATSIGSFSTFLMVIIWFLLMNQQRYPTRSNRRFKLSVIKKLVNFGTPSGLQCFLDVGAFTAIIFMIGIINREAMAVTTIALSINMICFLPLLGLSDATSIVVGQCIGGGNHNAAERVAYRSWLMAAVYMALAGTVFMLFPNWLIGYFAPQNMGGIRFEEVMIAGRNILFCAAIFNFFDATKFILMGALRGAGDTKVLMLICVCSAWFLMVPGVIIIIFVLKMSVVTVWIYLTIYVSIESSLIFWRFRSGSWRQIKLIETHDSIKSTQVDLPIPVE